MGRLLSTSALLAIVAAGVYVAFFSEDQFEPKSIKDQRVLVTGASYGIGEQLAYQYAKLGARLVITARRADLLRNVSRTCRDLGAPEVHLVAADMAIAGDRSEVIAHVQKHLGGLDHLILNHAFQSEGWWLGTAENLTLLEQILRVNFLSYVDLASMALPMLTATRGRIGIVSSMLGQAGAPKVCAYSSSKFALHGFFSSLRQELRHKDSGVSVTLVLLGPVATDTFLQIQKSANATHMPIGYLSTPGDAAQEILQSVSLRRYMAFFDWKTKGMLILHRFLPQFMEEFATSIFLNDDSTWSSRLMMFVWRTFY